MFIAFLTYILGLATTRWWDMPSIQDTYGTENTLENNRKRHDAICHHREKTHIIHDEIEESWKRLLQEKNNDIESLCSEIQTKDKKHEEVLEHIRNENRSLLRNVEQLEKDLERLQKSLAEKDSRSKYPGEAFDAQTAAYIAKKQKDMWKSETQKLRKCLEAKDSEIQRLEHEISDLRKKVPLLRKLDNYSNQKQTDRPPVESRGRIESSKDSGASKESKNLKASKDSKGPQHQGCKCGRSHCKQ